MQISAATIEPCGRGMSGAPPRRVLSLGAGVQSSTLLLMACRGGLEIDCAIFADTQWEPTVVYRWLIFLEEQAAAAGIPVYRVTAGNLRADALAAERRFASLPLHVRNIDGRGGLLRRQCTQEYKLEPIRRHLREHGAIAKAPATLLLGISLDEAHRMRDSARRYVRHEYPLIDRRMTRHDCTLWLQRHGYPIPPKSACIGCPYHNDAYWRALRDESPDEWADAVAFDAAVREPRRLINGKAYLHRSLLPLAEADIRSAQDRGQADMFGNECLGMCGV